jgi:hypothetical protein
VKALTSTYCISREVKFSLNQHKDDVKFEKQVKKEIGKEGEASKELEKERMKVLQDNDKVEQKLKLE